MLAEAGTTIAAISVANKVSAVMYIARFFFTISSFNSVLFSALVEFAERASDPARQAVRRVLGGPHNPLYLLVRETGWKPITWNGFLFNCT